VRSRLLALSVVAATAFAVAPGCSLGEGKGQVSGELDIPDCWAGGFDLKPDFFAAVPYRNTQLILRIQNGGDYNEFSDGLAIEVDDVDIVQKQLNAPLKVALSPEVTPPGVPVKAVPDPAHVHAALYLQRSCRVQNVALYAVDTVTLNSAGKCADESGLDGGSPVSAQACGALGASDAGPDASTPADAAAEDASIPDAATSDAAPPAPRKTASSWIRFKSISSGNPDATDASQRLNDADFELYLADPREICPGGASPPPCRGHLVGNFKFYYQRGKPAQPFP